MAWTCTRASEAVRDLHYPVSTAWSWAVHMISGRLLQYA